METVRLSGWQLYNMTSLYVIGTTFLILPGNLIADAKQYGWLILVWATLYGMILAGLWLYLSSRFPGLSVVQIAVQLFGKWAGGLVSLLYIVFFIQVASWVTRNLSDFMHINLMPGTPISVFNIMILLICAYAVVKGIESIAMVSELLGPYVYLAFWIPISLMLKEWDWRRFSVPYDFHPWETFLHTRYALAFPFMELVAFMMIFPFAGRRLKITFLSGIGVTGILLSLCVFFTIGILGVERSSHLVYPIFIIFREMQFTNFVEHVESIISVNILLLVCIKISLSFYCAVLAICQLFHIKARAVVAYPLVWIISAYSLFFESIVENVSWVRMYAFNYFALYAIVIPVILIAWGWLHKKGRWQRSEAAK
jgi:spore germination protein (amino acid permease)